MAGAAASAGHGSISYDAAGTGCARALLGEVVVLGEQLARAAGPAFALVADGARPLDPAASGPLGALPALAEDAARAATRNLGSLAAWAASLRSRLGDAESAYRHTDAGAAAAMRSPVATGVTRRRVGT